MQQRICFDEPMHILALQNCCFLACITPMQLHKAYICIPGHLPGMCVIVQLSAQECPEHAVVCTQPCSFAITVQP